MSIAFGEAVTGFSLAKLIVINGTASNLVDDGGGIYHFEVMPLAQGTIVAISPTMIVDAASNPSVSATPLTVLYDSIAPSPTFSTSVGSVYNLVTVPVTIAFGEAVSGFSLASLVVQNGSASNLVDLGQGSYRSTSPRRPTAW